MKFFALLLLIINSQIFSSSYATCDLKVEIIETSNFEKKEDGDGGYQQTKFKVIRFIEGEGHTKTYCKDYPGKEFSEKVFVEKEGLLKKDTKAKFYFETVSSEVVENEKVISLKTNKRWKFLKEYKWYFF
ncbi:MAG: hypothetical protein KDK36_09310 [Leptospiraceae bacterium]|nr:hypothetical protein [Leptospiraceae bacterium]